MNLAKRGKKRTRKNKKDLGPKRKNRKLNPIKVVHGNLLNHTTDYIMHQVNCLTKKCHKSKTHIATQIFEKYPKANVYSRRKNDGVPGNIIIIHPVISLLAMKYPGEPKWENCKENRFSWFKECLEKLENHFKDEKVSIGFPYKIGCGLAGGDWELYNKTLEDFGKKNENITLCMYKLQDKKTF